MKTIFKCDYKATSDILGCRETGIGASSSLHVDKEGTSSKYCLYEIEGLKIDGM